MNNQILFAIKSLEKKVVDLYSKLRKIDTTSVVPGLQEVLAVENEANSVIVLNQSGLGSVQYGAYSITHTDYNGRGITLFYRDGTYTSGLQFILPSNKVDGRYTLATLDDISNRPYKVYTAILTQSGTNIPVVSTLFEDELLDVVWSRTGIGIYKASSSLFLLNKCFVLVTSSQYLQTVQSDTLGEIILINRNYNGTTIESFTDTKIEIRVYN